MTLTASNDFSSDQVVKTDFVMVDDHATGLADRSPTAFGMYPNPTSGRLHIVTPEGAAPIQSIEVVNLSGALVMVIDRQARPGKRVAQHERARARARGGSDQTNSRVRR